MKAKKHCSSGVLGVENECNQSTQLVISHRVSSCKRGIFVGPPKGNIGPLLDQCLTRQVLVHVSTRETAKLRFDGISCEENVLNLKLISRDLGRIQVRGGRGDYIYIGFAYGEAKDLLKEYGQGKNYKRGYSSKDHEYGKYHVESEVDGSPITLSLWTFTSAPTANDECVLGVGLRRKQAPPSPRNSRTPQSVDDFHSSSSSSSSNNSIRNSVASDNLAVFVSMQGSVNHIERKEWHTSDSLLTLKMRVGAAVDSTLLIHRISWLNQPQMFVLSEENMQACFSELKQCEAGPVYLHITPAPQPEVHIGETGTVPKVDFGSVLGKRPRQYVHPLTIHSTQCISSPDETEESPTLSYISDMNTSSFSPEDISAPIERTFNDNLSWIEPDDIASLLEIFPPSGNMEIFP